MAKSMVKSVRKNAVIKGFGYDPIFIPEHHTTTFAEMSDEEKASMSHRGRAMLLFGDYIKNIRL